MIIRRMVAVDTDNSAAASSRVSASFGLSVKPPLGSDERARRGRPSFAASSAFDALERSTGNRAALFGDRSSGQVSLLAVFGVVIRSTSSVASRVLTMRSITPGTTPESTSNHSRSRGKVRQRSAGSDRDKPKTPPANAVASGAARGASVEYLVSAGTILLLRCLGAHSAVSTTRWCCTPELFRSPVGAGRESSVPRASTDLARSGSDPRCGDGRRESSMGQAGVIAPRPGVIPTRMDRSPGVIPGWTGRRRSDRKRVDGRGEFYGRPAGETAALRTGLGADRRRPATACIADRHSIR